MTFGSIGVAASQESGPAPRLVTSDEGLAIVNAAWEHEQEMDTKPDCSHLVHEVYRLAGFPYDYASSFDLYSGSGNFVRVRKAQPGDLIVWLGHVGLVVDPAEQTFYSSVRAGLQIENYSSPYWHGYGVPRFYRYRIEDPRLLTASAAWPARRNSPAAVQVLTVPVIQEDAAAPAAKQPARAVSTSADAAALPRAEEAEPARSVFEVPPSIRVVSRHGRPTQDEVAEALSELSNGTRNALRSDDLLRPRLPVVIYDQLRVERVQFKGERGWADVRVDSRVSLGNGRIEAKRRQEKHRWELRRAEAGWTALTPLDRVYVPRDVAVRVLAEDLARLAGSENASADSGSVLRQEAQLARLLNDLLKNR